MRAFPSHHIVDRYLGEVVLAFSNLEELDGSLESSAEELGNYPQVGGDSLFSDLQPASHVCQRA